MLLVDDHEAEVGERREHGRARADRDARLAALEVQPLVVALALAQLRVQNRDGVAEARLEARDRLRRERDLRHEHQHGSAGGERRLCRLQVDLGLARAGDAVQQEAAGDGIVGRAGCERREDRLQHRALLVGQRRRVRGARADGAHERAAALRARLQHEQAAVGEASQAAVVGARLRRRQRTRGDEPFEHGALAVGQSLARTVRQHRSAPFADLCDERGARPHARRDPAPGPGRQHQLQRTREGRAVLLADPARERHQLGWDRRLDACVRLGQPLVGQLRRARPLDHDAEQLAPRERDAQQRADVHVGQRLRQAVVERPAQGAGRRERLDAGDRGHGRAPQ